MPTPNKIDSNVVGLAIAEETGLKTLPGTPIWYGLEPNSYSDFGGSFVNTARNPINAGRQRKKGSLTDLDASGGFNTDLTQNNMQRTLQGFFFADAREKPTTQPMNGTAIAITSVAASTKTYAAASGLGVFLPKHLVLCSGFNAAANNCLDVVASATAGTVVLTAAKTDEAAPPATAKIEAVGVEFAAADVSLAATTSTVTLTSVAFDFTTLGLIPGEWVFIGGDATANKFTTNLPGYARISSVAAHALVFNETTFAASTEAGTGKSIRMFFGRTLKNEIGALIKRRSYQLERQLGNDGSGIQSEILVGSIPNEFTLNVPEAEKLNADLSFVSMAYETRNGTVGIKPGTRIAAANEDALNTSTNVYRMKMGIADPTAINPSALFAYVTDANISINNGVTANKAIGTLGAFDASCGDFEVSGSLTAYFSTVDAITAIKNNSDVSFNAIFASKNAGMVFDIPLMSLGGGRTNVEKDSPITLPIEMNAVQNRFDHTLLATFFTYLPTVAMPL